MRARQRKLLSRRHHDKFPSFVCHPVRGKRTLRWNILKSIWNIFLILVPCRLTKEPSDSNKRRQTLHGCCVVQMEGSARCPSAPQQLHWFWPRHSQFRQNKSTRALQLDLVSDKKYFTHRYCGYGGRCLHTKIHVKQFYHKDYDTKTVLLSWLHLFA